LAKATGRTLVLSPTMRFSMLLHNHPEGVRSYSYKDFFDISYIPMISMEEYLNRVAMKGLLRNGDGDVTFPPDNRTNWDGKLGISPNPWEGEGTEFFNWISKAMLAIDWKPGLCIIPFPSDIEQGFDSMRSAVTSILSRDEDGGPAKRISSYTGHPIPVNSSMPARLREVLADHEQLCEYNETYQEAGSIFMTGQESTGSRPLLQFFAYLFFESWEQDLQMKRFIRDHLRFSDILQCAAARIVEAIREIARIRGLGKNDRGRFDSMHVRRGDFKVVNVYKDGLDHPHQIVDAKFFETNGTVYISTDEKDMSFFEPLRQHHAILFLHDFAHLIEGIDPNFYGMIEQLVCAKGDKFVGTYYSSFTAYIIRVHGYHAQKTRSSEALRGSLNSEYMGHNGYFRNVSKVRQHVRDAFVPPFYLPQPFQIFVARHI
jgi:GDP-fucose protein O-fucosyltransferase